MSDTTRGFAFTCPRVDTLTGQGAVLACDHCRCDVYDLAALTRGEATALLARPDLPCVRLTVGADGRAIFRAPTPIEPAPTFAPSAPSHRPPARRSMGGALAVALAGALAAPAAAAPDAGPAPEAAPVEPCETPTVLATAAARLAALIADAEADARRAAGVPAQPKTRDAREVAALRRTHRLGGRPLREPPPPRTGPPALDDRAGWRARFEALVKAGHSHQKATELINAEYAARRAERPTPPEGQ